MDIDKILDREEATIQYLLNENRYLKEKKRELTKENEVLKRRNGYLEQFAPREHYCHAPGCCSICNPSFNK